MLYFAYGSNMSIRRLASSDRVPSAKSICVAHLPMHRLLCHKKSKDNSAKFDAYYTANAKDIVIGVIYDIAEAHKPKLDLAEGLGHGYSEKEVIVCTPKSTYNAITYYATDIDKALKALRLVHSSCSYRGKGKLFAYRIYKCN